MSGWDDWRAMVAEGELAWSRQRRPLLEMKHEAERGVTVDEGINRSRASGLPREGRASWVTWDARRRLGLGQRESPDAGNFDSSCLRAFVYRVESPQPAADHGAVFPSGRRGIVRRTAIPSNRDAVDHPSAPKDARSGPPGVDQWAMVDWIRSKLRPVPIR